MKENFIRGIPQRGFALLIAVIFMSVMLTFGLTLASLAYKQQELALSALGSQNAFYAADGALECALYFDQQQNTFNYSLYSSTTLPPLISCDGSTATQQSYSYTGTQLFDQQRISLDAGARCADVFIYKPSLSSGTTTIFAQGYDTSCSVVASPNGAFFSARGLEIYY